MDDMLRIVICRHCGKIEYYGEMRWLSGWYGCRSCYRARYETEHHKPYTWDDLDGPVPTFGEYRKQEEVLHDRG